ncbi:hypothetical protein NPX13_g7989 [Xylaria arbuscula]|uniref:Uncharacterized protein n=1 Tax=Xylaria arbuscula TaxID=114810 RepID=A0A9W8N907_9PEZI|nr:hypothetical protein NPX13_g7989 [Xylaria arbuscula]
MAVSLKFVEDLELLALDQDNLNILRATLQYPAHPSIKSAKLAHDIIFIVDANNCKDSNEGTPDVIWYVWSLILEISKCIPPDHPWQDSLLQAIGHLRGQDGTVPGMGTGRWEELPYLSMRIRELWNDPTNEMVDEVEEGEFTRWKNQNSFVARLTSPFFDPGYAFPLWQLRIALEEPPINGTGQECRLSNQTAFKTGSLCRDIPHFSMDRWNFWKRRLAEISADAGNLDLEPAIVTRISDTIKIMEEIST